MSTVRFKSQSSASGKDIFYFFLPTSFEAVAESAEVFLSPAFLSTAATGIASFTFLGFFVYIGEGKFSEQ